MTTPEDILKRVHQRINDEKEKARVSHERVCDGWKVTEKYMKLYRRHLYWLEKDDIGLQFEMNLGLRYWTWVGMLDEEKTEVCKALTEKYIVQRSPITFDGITP